MELRLQGEPSQLANWDSPTVRDSGDHAQAGVVLHMVEGQQHFLEKPPPDLPEIARACQRGRGHRGTEHLA